MKKRPLEQKESRLKRYGKLWLFLGAMAALGFLAQIQWIGLLLVVGYVSIAIIRRISSRYTYWLAYGALAMVPVGVVLTNWVAAQNFAAYAFLLFVGGVVQTTIELKRQHAPQGRT